MAKQKQNLKIISKFKTEWELTLLYKNENDPQIEADLKATEAACDAFAKKYTADRAFLNDARVLEKALLEYEKLNLLPDTKAYLYFAYRNSLDSRNDAIGARLNLISETLSKISNKILFFCIALSKIPEQKQADFLESEILKPYRYFLKRLFEQGKHTLSEAEEKILNLMELPAHSLWVRGNEKILGKQEIKWKGGKLPLSEALNKIHALPTKDRRKLAHLVNTQLKSVSDFAEHEMNAVVTDKKINDELHGYKKPYDRTVHLYQNEPETVKGLVDTVTKHFPIAHRFFKLKAKLLGEKKLFYADRNAEIGKTGKKISWEETIAIVKKAFRTVHPDYEKVFIDLLHNGQIDVFPKLGKEGGAYCSSHQDLPTYVFLNHISNFDAVTTTAHEIGHAIHSHFARLGQRPLYRDCSFASAETASTLFENFVFDEIFPLLSPKEQIIALHDRISDSIQTIFRQIACFNFELELHNTIRKQGSLSKEQIALLLNKHMKAYLGPLFALTPDDGYNFVMWSHLRRFFYVYSYAFGKIISTALYEMYKENPANESKIRAFLSAGGSASPEDIFASIGIDIRKPEFFELGLKKIEADIIELERLTLKNN